MFEKYNNEIRKIIKLLIMLSVTYLTVTNMEDIQITDNGLLKLLAIIGIVFMILENYYPSFVILGDI